MKKNMIFKKKLEKNLIFKKKLEKKHDQVKKKLEKKLEKKHENLLIWLRHETTKTATDTLYNSG